MIVWLIGMSSSGKTVIASEMIKMLKKDEVKTSWILLDGDSFRNIMGEDLGYTVKDRYKNAHRLSRFCAFLDSQGINVLACVLSIFHETQHWLRKNIGDYREVYIQVDYDILKLRDNKQLYERAERGEIDNVVGVQIDFPDPKNPDFVLNNNPENISPLRLATQVMGGLHLFKKKRKDYDYTKVDLLKTPCKYQYTSFEGHPFLEAYTKNRQLCLDDLFDKIRVMDVAMPPEILLNQPTLLFSTTIIDSLFDNIIKNKHFWTQILTYEILPDSSVTNPDQTIYTRQYLIDGIQSCISKLWGNSEQVEKVLLLIKRYEVTKKIYEMYTDPDLRRVGMECSDVLNYALFHYYLTCLEKTVDKEFSLVIQNAMLKIGDLLISVKNKLTTPAQLLITYATLSRELQLFKVRYDI